MCERAHIVREVLGMADVYDGGSSDFKLVMGALADQRDASRAVSREVGIVKSEVGVVKRVIRKLMRAMGKLEIAFGGLGDAVDRHGETVVRTQEAVADLSAHFDAEDQDKGRLKAQLQDHEQRLRKLERKSPPAA